MNRKGLFLIVGAILMSFLFIGVLSACGGTATEVAFIVEHKDVAKEVPFGTEFNLNGIYIRTKLSNGTFVALKKGESGYTVNNGSYDKEVPGTYTISISYKEYTPVSFKITVLEEVIIDEDYNPDLVMTGIAVKEYSGKLLYAFGEEFTDEGIIIEKVMSDDTKSTLESSQYTIDSTLFKADKFGEYIINVEYTPKKEFKTSYTVIVTPEAEGVFTSVSIYFSSAKTVYKYGENFTAANLIVEKNYMKDNVLETKVAQTSEYTVDSSHYTKNKLGKVNIIVRIKNSDITGSYEVEVIDYLAEITLNTDEAKKIYLLGEEFVGNGIRVSTITASGISEEADISDFTIDSEDFDAEIAGTYPINVFLTETPILSSSYTVTVSEDNE